MTEQTKDVAAELFDIFASRTDVYTVGIYDDGRTQYIKTTSKPLTVDTFAAHLDGDLTIGTYALSVDNTVRWLGWDLDAEGDLPAAREMTQKILAQLPPDLPVAVEFSGSKGFHVLVLLEDEMSAEEARSIADGIRVGAGLAAIGGAHCEVYPKQTKLTPAAAYGSLIKVPLGLHPKTKQRSKFVDVNNGWETGEGLDPLPILRNRASLDQVRQIQRGKDPTDIIVDLIVPIWGTGNRHELALALAGYLANNGWALGPATDVVRRICDQANDYELENRLDAVADTFQRMADRKPVKGYIGLSDLLPGQVMRQLTDNVIKGRASAELLDVDRIRLSKGSTHVKIRQVSDFIWGSLIEGGRFVRTTAQMHYFEHVTHTLLTVPWRPGDSGGRDILWPLLQRYGLNTAEGFGGAVYNNLRLRAANESDLVPIHKRSHWDGEKLFINLGGPEVYILDGKTVQLGWNGECGHIFESQEGFERIDVDTVNLTAEIAGTTWKYLVDPLSFCLSSDAPAKPEQQRELLKAWVLMTFFPELAPTKPLLLALGQPGSGKTTAMRRILKVLMGWDQDVLELATDKQDALRASIVHSQMLVLDNLEKTHAAWLIDTLNRCATGAEIQVRQLYKTMDVAVYRPNTFVAMTAVNLPFSDETLYTRLLPLEFQKLDKPLPEFALRQELLDNYHAIWHDLLRMLQRIVGQMQHVKVEPTDTRLADFATFCENIADLGIMNGDTLRDGIRSLSRQQQHALAEHSPFVYWLQAWKAQDPVEAAKPHTPAELLDALLPLARSGQDKSWRWKDARGLSRHVAVLEPQLVAELGCTIDERYDTSKGRSVKTYAFA